MIVPLFSPDSLSLLPPRRERVFAEARRKKRALDDVALGELAGLQHVAMARLHLKFTADTHALLGELLEQVRAKLLTYVVDEEGHLNPLATGPLMDFTASAWREMFKKFQGRFEAAREQAALISFAALARYHRHFMGLMAEKAEAAPPGQVGVVAVPFYRPQLQEVLDAAAGRVYGDGFKLSQRIWNLDQRGLKGLQGIIMETIASGDSAWNAAQRLESYLGANQECPRWTRTRLYKLTKTDIAAGDRTGLVSGSPCASKGVAYNALRLARNEIQIVHAGATDAIFGRMPWVEQEQVVLSPSHPPIACVCEEVAAGGEKGGGVYPKGTIALPLHVQCFPPDQIVSTDEGGKAIEKVQIGDRVLTHLGRYRRVEELHNRFYEGELLKITTTEGRALLVTPEHPILVNGEWVAADKVAVGDTLCVPPIPEESDV